MCIRDRVVITMPLLEGLDGVQKMSKSLGNYIGITESATEIFGKVMSVSDNLMWRYYDLLSLQSSASIDRLKEAVAAGRNPRDVKLDLAEEIVARFHGAAAGPDARQQFLARFQKGAMPDDMPDVKIDGGGNPVRLTRILKEAGLTPSTSEAMRMIRQGAVKIDGQRIDDPAREDVPGEGLVCQVGKRRFARETVT